MSRILQVLDSKYIVGPFFTTHDASLVDSGECDDDSDSEDEGMESSDEGDMPRPAIVARAESQGEGKHTFISLRLQLIYLITRGMV